MKEFYISLTGNDKNTGNINEPFLTVERAKEEARKYDEAVVYIRGGRYFINNTVEFDERDSNTVYKAYENETVIFDGGIIIDNSHIKKYKDGIMSVDLKPYNIEIGEYGNRGFRRAYINSSNELFIGGEPYSVARFPKKGVILYKDEDIVDSGSIPSKKDYTLRPAVLKLEKKYYDKWKNAKNAYWAGFPRVSWADECVKIASFNEKDCTITTSEPALQGYGTNEDGGWYIINLLEELTEKGEYYIDKENEILYFMPKNDWFNSIVQLSVMDKVMVAAENVRNLTIEGITFENSRNSGIYIEGGESVKIINCVFHNLGQLAIQMGQGAEPQPHGLNTCHGERAEGVSIPKPISREMGSWHEYLYEFAAWDNNAGFNHMISGCHIYNTGTGGILLSGGNRKKLISGNNMVENCYIHNVNRLDPMYKAGVNIMGVGNIVRNCEICELPAFAIYLHGNDHIIEYNKIHHVVKESSDSGAIYMGRDPSEVGNVFRYNFFYNIHDNIGGYGVAAIYFDDWAQYNEVYGNYFYDIVEKGRFMFGTVHWNNGAGTSVGNNIFIDCEPGIEPVSGDNAYDKMHSELLYIDRVSTKNEDDIRGVDVTSDVWKEKYPYLYESYVNNFLQEIRYYHNFSCHGQYHNFVDPNPKNLNFKLKEDSYLLEAKTKVTDVITGHKGEYVDFKNIDFDKIGLIK